ncbi:MAG: hypothetical protein ACQES1_07780 [Bacteroidota bacterium]
MTFPKPIILFVLTTILFACNQNTDNETGNNEETITENKDQDEAPATEAPESARKDTKADKEKSIKTKENSDKEAVYDLSELENGAEILGMPVSGLYYEPRDEYYFDLSGERILEGKLHKDPMSDMPAMMVNNNNMKEIKLIVNGQKLPIFSYIQISNEEALKSAMDNSMLEKYDAGKKIPVTMKVKGFNHGGRIDGYGGTNTEFVAFE